MLGILRAAVQVPAFNFCQFAPAPIVDRNRVLPPALFVRVSRFRGEMVVPLFLVSALCRILVIRRGNTAIRSWLQAINGRSFGTVKSLVGDI